MTRDDIDRAIATIEESLQSHIAWVDHPADCADCRAATPRQLVGDPEHHRRCIAGYNHVLMILRSITVLESSAASNVAE